MKNRLEELGAVTMAKVGVIITKLFDEKEDKELPPARGSLQKEVPNEVEAAAAAKTISLAIDGTSARWGPVQRKYSEGRSWRRRLSDTSDPGSLVDVQSAERSRARW